MIELLVASQVFFLAVGTLGLLRLDGTFSRMHATSVATTLGVASAALAGAAHFHSKGASMQSLLILFFMFLTAPTGSHLIARAHQAENGG